MGDEMCVMLSKTKKNEWIRYEYAFIKENEFDKKRHMKIDSRNDCCFKRKYSYIGTEEDVKYFKQQVKTDP